MESPNPSPYPYLRDPPVSNGSRDRPLLAFPVGTALLLMVIFIVSGIFSCCYHWDKLRRSLSLRAAVGEADLRHPSQPKPLHMGLKQSLPVIMPGDNVPKFIAMPCPCGPPKIMVDVQEPPPRPPGIAVPLY